MICALLGLVIRSTQASNFDVPALISHFIATVGAKDPSGRELRFLIDTGSSESYVDGERETAQTSLISFALGPIGFKARKTARSELPILGHPLVGLQVDGILGLDALRGTAIGFDYEKSAIRFWPHGASEGDEQQWVGDCLDLLLSRGGGGSLKLEANVSGRTEEFILDTGATINSASNENPSAAWHTLPFYNIKLTDATTRFRFYLAESTQIASMSFGLRTFGVALGRPFVENLLSPSFFGGPRLVIDFARRRLVAPKPTPESDLAMALSEMFTKPVRIVGDKVVMPDGSELLSIDSIKMSDLWAMRGDQPRLAATLAGLYQAMKPGCPMILLFKGKKVFSVAKRAQPGG